MGKGKIRDSTCLAFVKVFEAIWHEVFINGLEYLDKDYEAHTRQLGHDAELLGVVFIYKNTHMETYVQRMRVHNPARTIRFNIFLAS